MPLTIITLSKSPPALKGDLTKWMQEIATGVYVGNFNRKIRGYLWKRVCENIGDGQATIAYADHNELGYNFDVKSTHREIVYYDHLPLVRIPRESESNQQYTSKARIYHQARKYGPPSTSTSSGDYVILDLETTGLDPNSAEIIEIAVLKIMGTQSSLLHKLVKPEGAIPSEIVELTGISSELVETEGIEIDDAIDEVLEFIGDLPIVGYNVVFDIQILEEYLPLGHRIKNSKIDLIGLVKKEYPFLPSYQLKNVLTALEIPFQVIHRAHEDVALMYELIGKLNRFNDWLQKWC